MPRNGERACLALDASDLFAGLRVSNVDEVVLGGGGEQLRVMIEAQRAHGPLEARKCAQTAQRLHVPQRGERICRAGSEVLAALVELEAYAVGQMGLDVVHLVEVRIAEYENGAEAGGNEEQVALLVPRYLVDLELELTLARESVRSRVDERDQIVFVANCNAPAVRRPAYVDVLACSIKKKQIKEIHKEICAIRNKCIVVIDNDASTWCVYSFDRLGRTAIVQTDCLVAARCCQKVRMTRMPAQLIHQIRVSFERALFGL